MEEKTIKDWIAKFERYISGMPPAVFNQTTLSNFFHELRKEHLIPYELNYENFIALVSARNTIQITKIKYVGTANSERKEFIRYICNSPSPFSIGLSLRSRSYLSHNSALFLNGLIDEIPRKMCINMEQSPKTNSNELMQVGIERAFKKKSSAIPIYMEMEKI